MRRLVLAAVATLSLAGCGESPTEVPFQVIEETQFAASLGIDLAAMTRLGTGVYTLDLVVGGGEPVVFGTTPTVTYTGWLADGTEFDSGTISFFMGNNQVVSGFEDGLLNTRVGGTRRVIIPPGRGYGGVLQYDAAGNIVVPAGSILVFEITVDALATN